MKLFPRFIPKNLWGRNLRSMIPREEWDLLRKRVYREYEYKCAVCEGRGDEHPVECHEKWHYNDKKRVLKLIGLVALCPCCHKAVHFGFAHSQGMGEMILVHLMIVNEWSRSYALAWIEAQAALWKVRSEEEWRVDIGWIAKRAK